MKLWLYSFIGMVMLLPGLVSAETVIRTGDSVSIATDQRVESDFYAAANVISMSGNVAGDMYAVGGTVTVNGDIDEDLTVIGGSANVHATVTDDVRVVGGETVIAEAVGGDVFVIGGVLKVLSSAHIAGDVYFFGGEADISGSVGGSVVGDAEQVRIDATIGSVDLKTSRGLTLGSRAHVLGDVQTESATKLTRAPEAVIGGDVIEQARASTVNADLITSLVTLGFAVISALIFYVLFAEQLRRLVEEIVANYTITSLTGLGTFFVTPAIAILLVFAMAGAALGFFLFFLWLALLLLAWVSTGVVLGALVALAIHKQPRVEPLYIIIGVCLTYTLLYIPVLGGILLFVLFVLTLGGLVLSLRQLL